MSDPKPALASPSALPSALLGPKATIWEQAYDSLAKFCKGKHRMCVPVQQDDDDLVIARALDEGERLAAQLAAATDALAASRAVVEAASAFHVAYLSGTVRDVDDAFTRLVAALDAARPVAPEEPEGVGT